MDGRRLIGAVDSAVIRRDKSAGRVGAEEATMARVFITGSSDGLGLMAARLLIEQGHEVVVHGRNEARRVETP
jgi:hypothetical protein